MDIGQLKQVMEEYREDDTKIVTENFAEGEDTDE